jgi:hypothetical protein
VASTTSPFGLTDLHFFDECFDRPEFFLDRSFGMLPPRAARRQMTGGE